MSTRQRETNWEEPGLLFFQCINNTPLQTALPTTGQVFKHRRLYRPVSFKPLKGLLPFSTWWQLLLLFLGRTFSPLLLPTPITRQVFSLMEQDFHSIREQLVSPFSIPVLHLWARVAQQASITELKPLLGKSPAGFSP